MSDTKNDNEHLIEELRKYRNEFNYGDYSRELIGRTIQELGGDPEPYEVDAEWQAKYTTPYHTLNQLEPEWSKVRNSADEAVWSAAGENDGYSTVIGLRKRVVTRGPWKHVDLPDVTKDRR